MNGRARIAWNLRRLRSEKGISQENLAVDADIDRTYISGIERQEFNPSIDLLDRIATALSIDVTELLAIPEANSAMPQALKPGRKSKV